MSCQRRGEISITTGFFVPQNDKGVPQNNNTVCHADGEEASRSQLDSSYLRMTMAYLRIKIPYVMPTGGGISITTDSSYLRMTTVPQNDNSVPQNDNSFYEPIFLPLSFACNTSSNCSIVSILPMMCF